MLEALAELQRLGAGPATVAVRQRLKALGVAAPRGPRAATRANPQGLTPRELEVLRGLAAGSRNADIASELVLSRRTVDHHVSAILRKLGVDSRGGAVRAARESGLLDEPPQPEADGRLGRPLLPPPARRQSAAGAASPC
jgi:DNA-binding NarL/FixJ family response regulator